MQSTAMSQSRTFRIKMDTGVQEKRKDLYEKYKMKKRRVRKRYIKARQYKSSIKY